MEFQKVVIEKRIYIPWKRYTPSSRTAVCGQWGRRKSANAEPGAVT